MNREITEPREGRMYFVVLDLLVGVGVMMAAAAIGVLFLAALSF